MTSVSTGQRAEQIACEYLCTQGCKLHEQNFYCLHGEIDLIMQDNNELVFVEVRYRGKEDFGSGAATVSRTKQRKIIKSAQFYLQEKKINHTTYCRFDVVSITLDNNAHKIDWIKDAFQLN